MKKLLITLALIFAVTTTFGQTTSPKPGGGSGSDATKLPLAGGTMTGPIVGLKDKGGQVFNVKSYGAIGDGSTHPLSGTYASVAAAAAVYPFVGTVHYVKLTDPGKDYTSAPTVTFSSGAAVAHAVVADQQVSRINLTSGGTGYNVPPKVTFSGGVCTYYPKADAIVSGGAVTSVIVKYGGLSCSVAPTVTIASPLSNQATATFTVSGGVPVSPATMTNIGLGYTSGTTCSLSGGDGLAICTPTITDGRITGITITGGTGYSAGSVTISAPNGTQATATADVNGLLGLVITNAGSGYTSAPTISFSGGGGTGAAATAYVPLLTDELDWAAAQLAVNSLDATYGGTVLFPTGKYKISQPIKLSEGNGGGISTYRTVIRGEGGAYLLASSAIDIIQRIWTGASTDAAYVGVTVPSQRIAQANNWEISGLFFQGPGASVAGDGSHAINVDCTYNLSLHHLYIQGFDTGIENNFGLMTSLEFSQFRNSETADYVGKRMLDSFATNSFMARRNRHQSDQQSLAAIRIWGGSGAKIQDSIFEAYSPRITIDADALGYSTATDVTIRGIHLESDYAYSPPYTFAHVAVGGRAIIDDIFPQEGDDDGPLTLVDGSDITGSGISVLVSNVSNIPTYLRFRGLAYAGIGWQLRNVGTVDWNTPSGGHVWDTSDGAAKPNNLYVEKVMTGAQITQVSQEAFEKLAVGNTPNSERFRVSQASGSTYYPGTFTLDNIAAFHVDDAGGYIQSWFNDTYGANAAGRVKVDNSGNVDISAVADKNLTFSVNGSNIAKASSSGFIVPGLTANRALATGTGGLLAVSSTTSTELGYLSGVTSAIQTQLNLLAPLASPTFTGTVTTPALTGLTDDSATNTVATPPIAVSHKTSGAPAVGFGTGYSFMLSESAGGAPVEAARIEAQWGNSAVDRGMLSFKFRYSSPNAFVTTEKIQMYLAAVAGLPAVLNFPEGNGQIKGVSTFDLGTGSLQFGSSTLIQVSKTGNSLDLQGYPYVLLTDTLNGGVVRVGAGMVGFGTTSAFPALKRDSTVIGARLADDSAPAWLQNTAGEGSLTAAFTNATTTMASSLLSYTVAAGRSYRIHGILAIANSTAGNGVKLDFDGGSATATTFWAAAAVVSGSVVAGTTASASLAGDINFTTVTGTAYIVIDGYLKVNAAGTLILRAAEDSTGGASASLAAGSWIALSDTILK